MGCKNENPRLGVRTPHPESTTVAAFPTSYQHLYLYIGHLFLEYLSNECDSVFNWSMFWARRIRNTKITLFWPPKFSSQLLGEELKGARYTETNRTIWRESNTSMAHGQVIGSKQSQPSDKRNARGFIW